MILKADYIKDIVIQDPDTGGDVEVTLFKHECGGIFGLDASWIEQVAGEDSQGNPIIMDPFSESFGNMTTLIYPDNQTAEDIMYG
jgi:hypothetical protein